MPTWGELLVELNAIQTPDKADLVRRKYLRELSEYTHRNVILYSTKWTITPTPQDPSLLSITDEDMEGLMEVIHGLDSEMGLDLIIHSPGGSAEAAEALVKYLRTKFPSSIRIIIPQAAMSAATMIACAGNEIVMGKHSCIGPIDPQIMIPIPAGNTVARRMVPARAIEEQFKMAKQECRDPANLASWFPILPSYGPSLLKECEIARNLSEKLVKEWLELYMFAGETDAQQKASNITSFLLSDEHCSHGRHIDREKARTNGLKVINLEADSTLQDLVLSVYHATSLTFMVTGAVKIIENHLGKAFLKQQQTIILPMQPGRGNPSLTPGQ